MDSFYGDVNLNFSPVARSRELRARGQSPFMEHEFRGSTPGEVKSLVYNVEY